MKKRITALALAFVMVLGTVAVAAGAEKTITVSPMTLTINGQAVTPTKSNGAAAEVFAYDGATYVPLRYLAELMGLQVDWDKNDPSVAKVSGNIALGGGDGTYTGTGAGFGGLITATVTVVGGKITACTLEGASETPAIGGAALPTLEGQFVAAGSASIDGVAGATLTSNGAKEAVAAALAQAQGAGTAALSFTPGTYTATGAGYGGPLELSVTFSETAVTNIEVVSHAETLAVGTPAYDIVIPDIVAANGTGVDSLSGATFTTRGIKEAVNAAAEKAGATNMNAFKSNTIKHEAGAPIEGTWDVIVVGAGGAGMAAAAQAAQNGATVLVIEKNAEIGGNTVVAGGGTGGFQAYVPYLCWEADDPEATTGYCDYDGQTYDKHKANSGSLEVLRTIANWSEKPFDGTVDAAHPFEAGNVAMNAVRGVHAEFLPVLKTLKSQIQAYLTWADKKIAAGAEETDLTLFSSDELHIFQTYYGGLRPNADNTDWIYGDVDLITQFVEGALPMKYWLMDQGAKINMAEQNTLIGCLWQRINGVLGATVDGVEYTASARTANYGVFMKVPEKTLLSANAANKILTRTTANELIVENGKVTGVKATQYDGTPVTVKATKGVILATGGYAANISMVQEHNEYWKPEYISSNIGTTNRSSQVGDGIVMGQAVGAEVVGMGWPQMMPLGWVDNGNLSLGAGENVIFVNANTGKRYVDESAERDVLSLGGFENGMNAELAAELGLKDVPGIYVEFSNPTTNAMYSVIGTHVENRVFVLTVAEAAAKLHLDEAVLRKTITDYDNYVMGVTDTLDVPKLTYTATIGDVEKDANGNYKPETYKLDKVIVRFMAPSTHHTMGGLKVDTERRVISTSGSVIPGLWAAGEVTGGLMAGNRLGGNALIDIVTAGRIAADSATGK